ncbi:MAG: ArgE/DapE family deacylase [Thermodesulfobacteriota bacterium]
MSLSKNEVHLLETVNGLRDEVMDFTLRLVEQKSTVGNEKGALGVMEDRLKSFGLDPFRITMDKNFLSTHPGYAPVPWEFENRYNLVAIRNADASGGRSAVFNGHLDVVPPGLLDHWETDPFQPVVREGRIYGRGTGDMKSGVAAMTYALHAVAKANLGLSAPVTLQAVIEEECSGNGALTCVASGYTAEAVLIPEPVGPTLLTHQLGVLWFKIKVQGAAVHASEAPAGVNAIEKSFKIISALRGLESDLNKDERPPAYLQVAHPLNLNIGIISGGDWPSTVPSSAEFHCRLAYFPGTSFGTICSRIKSTLDEVILSDPWLSQWPPTIEYYGLRSDGHSISRGLPALTVLNDCHRTLTGKDAAESILTATTDLRAFHFFGNAQGTCYGPEAKNIHGANESVSIDSVMHVARAYALFLSRWCGLVE